MSLEGQQFGEFEILERLGQGGMGSVYKARQTSLDRFVALKTLQAGLADDEAYIARFRQEAKAAAGLNHPNLVQVYSAGHNDGLYWFAMEYVEGESAKARLKRQVMMDPLEAIAIALHVATALEYGWRKAGLIHRDIKPDNIFLSNDGEVKLGDLGLAKSAGQTQGITVTGHSMGTPYYISPEQVQDMKEVDLRADIYSLGCTLFHLVSGKPPFDGSSGSTIMLKHITQPVPNLRDAWAECPAVLHDVVHRMMEKEPEGRQQSYGEVIEDLQRVYDVVSDGPTAMVGGIGDGESQIEDRAEAALAAAEKADTEDVPVEVTASLASAPMVANEASGKPGAASPAGVKPVVRAVPVAVAKRSKGPLFIGVAAVLLLLGIAIAFLSRPGAKPSPVVGDSAKVGSPELASSTSGVPASQWIDALADPAGLDLHGSTTGPDGVNVHGGVDLGRYFMNGAIRITTKYDPAHPRYNLRVRSKPGRGYNARITGQGQVETFQWGAPGGERKDLLLTNLLHALVPGQDYTLEMRGAGDRIVVTVNGEPVVVIPDPAPITGGWSVDAQDDVLIKKLEYHIDDTPGGSSPAPTSTTALEPGAMRLWDKTVTEARGDSATFEDGVVKLLRGSVQTADALGTDGVIRTHLRPVSDSLTSGVELRLSDRDGGSSVQAGYEAASRKFSVGVVMGGKYIRIHDWPAPRSYAPEEWFLLELRAVGDVLTLSVDGQMLGSVKIVAPLGPGRARLFSSGGADFRDTVYVPLDGKTASSGSDSAALESGAMRLWDTAEKVPKDSKISFDQGVVTLRSANFKVPGIAGRDGILRAMVRSEDPTAGIGMQLRRTTVGTAENSIVLAYEARLHRIAIGEYVDGHYSPIVSWAAPRAYGPEDWFALELRAVGDSLTASVDGQVLGTVHSYRWLGQGAPGITGAGSFRAVVYVPLDGTAGAAPGEPGAVRLWDTPEKIPKDVSATLEFGALQLQNGILTTGTAGRDGIIRAGLCVMGNEGWLGLSLRGSHRQNSRNVLRVGYDVRTKEFVLAVVVNDQHTDLKRWKPPREYGTNDWFQLELRAVADTLTVSVDGRVLGTVRSGLLMEPGDAGIMTDGPAMFRDIVYVPLDGTPSGAAATPASLEPGAMRLWDTAAKTQPGTGVTLKDGVLELQKAHKVMYREIARDGLIRADMAFTEGNNSFGVALREVDEHPQKAVQLNYEVAHQQFTLRAKINDMTVALGTWPRHFAPGEWFHVELRVVGDTITATVNGEVLGVVQSPAVMTPGCPGVYSTEGVGSFRDIVYVPLDKSGAAGK